MILLSGSRPALVAAVLVLLAVPATARTRCFTEAEVLAEQLVRHGVLLREASGRCDEYLPGSAKLWTDFNQSFGPRLLQQTERRRKVFQREFANDWTRVMTYFDGRLVTYHRHYPLTLAYCTMINELLDENGKRGWKSFVEQAKTTQNEVLLDYKTCPPGTVPEPVGKK